MPNFNGRGSPSFAQGPKGLADMLASALRGGVKATLGMPGDIERMGRMGINALGGSVDPQSALPSTEDWDKRLPPVNPMTGQNFDQVEKMGEFLPLNAGGPIMRAAGKANSAVQALRQSAPAVTNMGRRTALKGLGAAGAGAAMAPELVVQALRNVPATPASAKVVAPVAAEVAAKVATKLTPDFIANALSRYAESWGLESLSKEMISPAVVDSVKSMGLSPEEFRNVVKWADYETEYSDEAADVIQRSEDFLKNLSSDEVRRIAIAGPDNLPTELIDQGVTHEGFYRYLFPEGGRRRPNLENPHEDLSFKFGSLMDQISEDQFR